MHGGTEREFNEVWNGVKQRVRDRVKRHLAVNPRADRRKIIDLQINGERERFRRTIEHIERYDLLGPFDEALLYLAKQMKEGR